MSTSQLSRVLTQWSIGMAVSTPLVAILQGSLLLSNYRINYRDAPRPITPSSGVIVALAQQGAQARNRRGVPLTKADKPLRLLVVGDSLAAGVGVSGNGLPILPESIAKALSKAFRGRVVCWTCLGTPGISASQIVQDINSIPKREPRRLENLFQELKTKRDRWRQLQNMEMERLDYEESTKKQQSVLLKIIDWWKAEEKQPISEFGKEIAESGAKWWKTKSRRIQQTYSDIKEVIHAKPPGDIEKNLTAAKNSEGLLLREGNIFRRDSLDPFVASSFDVAVVLLGLNDLKEAFMPHITKGANSSFNEGAEPMDGALTKQLRSVFFSLEKIMGKMDNTQDHNDATLSTEGREKVNSSKDRLHPPLVVVPELPVAPLEAFRLVPLCWILLPLFRAMERNKKFLSSTFPDHVVFIDQPGLEWWSDAERRHNSYMEEDESVLRLTDTAQTAQARVKQLMQRFYNPNHHTVRSNEQRETGGGNGRSSLTNNFSEESYRYRRKSNGTLYIAQDKMHPNDEGYDLWGRHIAEAVVRHWSRPQV
ncbi:unnamed protein product [Cylindrotheca closterium]|uniref:SGNH hydrolase-type esterase domain-containing protein n=1 Tax=Cylindrotheca closterium TaxID=2856 RepID=A0AAD2G242_9STRA|nr:unnamed protein product [Cylindrotheca closterium]